MTLNEVENLCEQLGQPRFRAKQLYTWLQKGVDFDRMTNISKQLRQQLSDIGCIALAKVEDKFCSALDETVKYLFRMNDGAYVESVLMKYKYGYTLCVSSQVGCRMGCRFCASTIGGLQRSLTASEILAQITAAQFDSGVRISHIVMMGMGEPLDNFDNVTRFIELVTSEDGLNISARHISLSTCGKVDGIYKLMERLPQITLSVSLHAPDDKIRSSMMPINNKWGVDELLRACRDYTDATHRRISFEYSLINGVNDSDECALLLAKKLKGMLCHVNLIPVNEVRENDYKRSTDTNIRRFQNILVENGINTTVRRTLGADIQASCGQLRQRRTAQR